MTALREELTDLGSDLAPTAEEKAAVRTLVKDVTTDLRTLVRQEVELAKAEITGEVSKIGKGVGMLAGAALAALMTLIFLSTALWWALANVMDQSWAALVVAGVWVVIGAALYLVGRGTLASISLTPERTIRSLKQFPAVFSRSTS